MRDLCRRTLGIHVANEDLLSARLALRDVRDALAVRRPVHVAALDELPLMGAVGAHLPDG